MPPAAAAAAAAGSAAGDGAVVEAEVEDTTAHPTARMPGDGWGSNVRSSSSHEPPLFRLFTYHQARLSPKHGATLSFYKSSNGAAVLVARLTLKEGIEATVETKLQLLS